jgi:cation transport regulator ChaB
LYNINAITADTQGFLTVDEFDQEVRKVMQEEKCDYIRAAILSAWRYMVSIKNSVSDPLSEAHNVCIGAAISKWKASDAKWYNGMRQLTTQFMEWGYRYG